MSSTLENVKVSKESAKLASNLTNLMRDKDIDTKELSALTGISISLLNALKRGDGNPTLGTLITLANFFDVTIDTLILSDARKSQTIMIIPVYALQTAHAINQYQPLKNIHLKIEDDNSKLSCAIQIDNSSLMPFFDKGSIFLISNDKKYTDGDLVLVRINQESNVFRRIFIKNKGLLFQYISLNADPHTYDAYEIIGVVIKVIHTMGAAHDTR